MAHSGRLLLPSEKARWLGIDEESLFISGKMPAQESLPLDQPDSSPAYLVAVTKDGGPYKNLYFPGPQVKNASLWSCRNFHESWSDGQCMHFQESDDYDAKWQHWCANGEWKEGRFAGPGGGAPEGLELSALMPQSEIGLRPTPTQFNLPTSTGSFTLGRMTMWMAVSEDLMTSWFQPIYSENCDGDHLRVLFLDLEGVKGIEVLSSSPKLSDICFDKVKQVVNENGLQEWMPSRANIDMDRPLEDWPW